MYDSIIAPRRHPGCAAARDEPVEDRLDLVGGGVPGRAQAVAGDGVALLPQLRLAKPSSVELDHLGAEHVAAEPRIRRRVVTTQQVVHVQGGDAVAERAERVPEAGRVRTAGDEAADLGAGLDQVMPADVLFDPCAQQRGFHGLILPRSGKETGGLPCRFQ